MNEELKERGEVIPNPSLKCFDDDDDDYEE